MSNSKIHYVWIVAFLGLLVTIGAHGFGRMSYTIILPAMKDGLSLNYTQLGLIGTGNFIGYLLMALGSAWFVALFLATGQTLGRWAGGYLADLTQSFTVPFLLAAGVSLVGSLLALGLKPAAVSREG